MNIRRTISGAVAAAILIVPVAAAAANDNEEVLITDGLEPAQVTVAADTTVTWRNLDGERHRMRSKDGPVEFDSGNLEQGESFSFTFSVEGSYPYQDHRDREDSAYFGTIIVTGDGTSDSPLLDSGTVSIIDRSFRPGSLAVRVGGAVEWSNDDGEAHTVTSTQSTFDSGILGGGAPFSQTFSEAGSYPYFCAIHPEMRGTIEVRDADAEAAIDEPADEMPATEDEVPGTADEPPPATVEGEAPTPVEVMTTAATTVSLIDRSFQPDVVEVSVGQTVAWSNDDTEGHTVTASDGAFNSGVMTVGDAFEPTFDSAGTVDYFCAIHPEMSGSVIVSVKE